MRLEATRSKWTDVAHEYYQYTIVRLVIFQVYPACERRSSIALAAIAQARQEISWDGLQLFLTIQLVFDSPLGLEGRESCLSPYFCRTYLRLRFCADFS
jgi:hypothetical protein